MKIMIQNRYYFPSFGGIENSLYYIAAELTKKGHEVIIYTKRLSLDFKCEERTKQGFNILRYHYKLPKVLFFLDPIIHYFVIKKGMNKILINNKIDLIITRDPVMGLATLNNKQVYLATSIMYVPAVIIKYSYVGKINNIKISLKGILEVLRFIRFFIEGEMQRKLLRKCFRIAVFSKNMKSQIFMLLKQVNDKKIKIIPPGVDEQFTQIKTNELLNQYGIPQDKKIFLYVGRIEDEKNVDLLLDAFCKLENTNSILLMVGDGALLVELKQKAIDLGRGDRIFFVGFKENTVDFYNIATYLILPTKYEAFGQVIIESLACGTPVIGFKSNNEDIKVATDEIIEEGKTGFLCEKYGAEFLSKTMAKALEFTNNQAEYTCMRATCIQEIKRHYTWEKFTDEVLNFCKRS